MPLPELQERAALMGSQFTNQLPVGKLGNVPPGGGRQVATEHPAHLRGPLDLGTPPSVVAIAPVQLVGGRWQRKWVPLGRQPVPLRPPGAGPVPGLVDRPDVQVSRVSTSCFVPHVVVRNRHGVGKAGDGCRDANGQLPTRRPHQAFHRPESGIDRPPRLDPGQRRLRHPGLLGQLPLTQIGPPTQSAKRPAEIGSAGRPGIPGLSLVSPVWLVSPVSSLTSVTVRCSRLVGGSSTP